MGRMMEKPHRKTLLLGILAAAGIVFTQLPVEEVQAWAVPQSPSFVPDTVTLEAASLPRDVLPGVSLVSVFQEGDRVVYAYDATAPLDTRREKQVALEPRCAVWKRALLRGDVAELEHRYHGEGQARTFFIRRADCR